MTFRLLIAALACAVFPAAASSLVPAAPSSFDPVVLRMTVDGCTFAPSTVRVTNVASVIRVSFTLNACLVAGPTQVADVRLGTLAVGDYRVDVYPGGLGNPATESISFTVRERPEAAIVPPPPRPLNDYSGMWWTPTESGSGLSLHQNGSNTLFGSWFVFDGNGNPTWFTFQGGQWTSSTRWAGTIYRTTLVVGDPQPPARAVTTGTAGTVTLDFTQTPATVDTATLTYTLGGSTFSRTLGRFTF